jgi:hypothetical protein
LWRERADRLNENLRAENLLNKGHHTPALRVTAAHRAEWGPVVGRNKSSKSSE